MEDQEFAAFWKAYPRKAAKGDARKAWFQVARVRPPIETILQAIEQAKKSQQWRRDGGDFIPYPATWLRAERWDDEYEVPIENPISSQVVNAWWISDEATLAYGKQKGVEPRPGESMNDYRTRLRAA